MRARLIPAEAARMVMHEVFAGVREPFYLDHYRRARSGQRTAPRPNTGRRCRAAFGQEGRDRRRAGYGVAALVGAPE